MSEAEVHRAGEEPRAAGAVVVLDDHYVIYVPPDKWTAEQHVKLRQRLDDIRVAHGWTWEFLVLPGPVMAYDFRGDPEMAALARAVAGAIKQAS